MKHKRMLSEVYRKEWVRGWGEDRLASQIAKSVEALTNNLLTNAKAWDLKPGRVIVNWVACKWNGERDLVGDEGHRRLVVEMRAHPWWWGVEFAAGVLIGFILAWVLFLIVGMIER